MLVDGAALGRHIAPQSGQRLLQPRAAIDNQELRLQLVPRAGFVGIKLPHPGLGRFTEGFDTPDLKEAKALLDTLL